MARVVSIHEYQLKPDADRIAFEGIVNLSGVVCCSCRWRGGSGREVVCSPIVLPRSNRAGPLKGALGPLS